MRLLYSLFLEKVSRDIAVSAAVGVTAGLRAAVADGVEGQTLESRVEMELDAVLDELRRTPSIMAGAPSAIEDAAPKKRGRPRKNPLPEIES